MLSGGALGQRWGCMHLSRGVLEISLPSLRVKKKKKEKKDEEINIKMKTRLTSYPYVTCL